MAKKPVKAAAKKSVKTKSAIKPDRTFLITGHVTDSQTGVGVAGLLVKVVDKDKQYEQFLGCKTTSEQGLYEITVNASQIGKHERGGPDITVKVFDKQGTELAASEVVYDATAKTIIDLSVTLHREPELSEYETLIVTLTPFLRGKQIADHSNDEIITLAKAADLHVADVRTLVAAHKATGKVGLPAEVLFALGENGKIPQVTELATIAPADLKKQLQSAAKTGVIPPAVVGSFDDMLPALGRLQLDHAPLSNIAKQINLKMPSALTKALAAKNINTLSDIQLAGGLDNLKNLPDTDLTRAAVQKLESHAQLSLLSPDSTLREKLIERGFDNLFAVADSDSAEFAKKNIDLFGKIGAARISDMAKAQAAVVKNIIVDKATQNANLFIDDVNFGTFPHGNCSCDDCESAVSPLAYLADLIKYIKDNLRNGSKPVFYTFLEDSFHQKFGKLPVSCEAMDTRVRQVRIAIEVLHKHYKSTSSADQRKAIKEVYHALLIQIGTSYAELRLAMTASDDDKAELAEKLGVSKPTAGVDHLKDLLLDIENLALPDLEDNYEKIFGFASTQKDPLASRPTPQLLEWRRSYLREQWHEQDWPDDMPDKGYPIIDPDIIDPDDFRSPTTTDKAFALWKLRREWVDGELENFKSQTRTVGTIDIPDIEKMLDIMYAGRSYPFHSTTVRWPVTMPKKDLTPNYQKLASGKLKKEEVEQILKQLDEELGLSADAFNYLMGIRDKDNAWSSDSRNPKVSDEEWSDLISILTQALKRLLFGKWLEEEDDNKIEFDPNAFWIALREPIEGDWPPVQIDNVPFIDPGLLKTTDLPDSEIGEDARIFYDARTSELEDFGARLPTIRTDPAKGFVGMLQEALGNPLPVDLDQTESNLASSDTTISIQAENDVRTELYLTLDAFLRLMAIRAKENQAVTALKPTAAEYEELCSILTVAYKLRDRYPTWDAEEKTKGLKYWQALKARLPRWRASAESRADWQRVLRLRMRPAIIDPDLIAPLNIRHSFSSDDAWMVWIGRHQNIQNKFDKLKSDRETADAATPGTGLNTIFTGTLGISKSDLVQVDKDRADGKDITARLAQLNLSNDGFNYLVRMSHLVDAHPTIEAQEWEAVYSILVQVWKERNIITWHEEERTPPALVPPSAIVLTPDKFSLPKGNNRPQLDAWRASYSARLDWEDTLQARIDQDQTLENSLRNAVDATEEVTLPLLRNVLIMEAPGISGSLEARAKQLSDRLLIEMMDNGCAKTTRISQAIETLQNLLFSVRTGQLLDTYPNLAFTKDAQATFDEDWVWMGSYSTWRAAMFVFLYPDNILLPSLRTEQSPAFSDMVKELRSLGQATPERARLAARKYADYFQDICSLKLEATVTANVTLFDEDGTKTPELRLFLFARSSVSDKAYWCTRPGTPPGQEPRDATDQTFWSEIPILGNVINLIGSVEYDVVTPTERFIYLFAGIHDGRNKKLVFCRYDLERAYWIQEINELELPNKATSFTEAELVQTTSAIPPKLNITLLDGSTYTGSLGEMGKDWGAGGPQSNSYTVTFVDWKDGSRNAMRIGNTTMPSLDHFTPKDATKWIKAAHDFGKTQDGFITGFPTFVYDGDNFGVVMLSSQAVQVTWIPSSDLGNAASVSDSYTAQDLAGRFGVVQAYIGGHRNDIIAGFPNFDDSDEYYGVVLIRKKFQNKDVVKSLWPLAISNMGAISRWTTNSSPNPNFNAYQFSLRFQHLSDPDKWASLQISGTHALPTFIDTNGVDNICYIYDKQQYEKDLGSPVNVDTVGAFKPDYSGSFDIIPSRSKPNPGTIANTYNSPKNQYAPQSLLTYLDEAWYFAPVHIALQLQRSGYFTEALDWFRLVYDYTLPVGSRKVFYGLVKEQSRSNNYNLTEDWFRDPLNPHAIAQTRQNVYTRFTLMSLIRCFLDYADAEFTRDTSESVPLARTLYETALELLDANELKQSIKFCSEIIGYLNLKYGDLFAYANIDFDQVHDMKNLKNLSDDLIKLMDSHVPPMIMVEKAHNRVQAAIAAEQSPQMTIQEAVEAGEKRVGKAALTIMSIAGVANELYSYLDRAVAGKEIAQPENAHLLMVQPGEVENIIPWRWGGSDIIIPALIFPGCIPPNPVLDALRMRPELNLFKIRTCRNIAGAKRELEPYAAPTDTSSGMPVIGAGGQLVLPGLGSYRPTPYRYTVLVERAKQLVQLAQQVESSMLSAFQQRDAEAYNKLKARQDIETARGNVSLQNLRKTEADAGVGLATLQRDRASIQSDHYQELLSFDLFAGEILALDGMLAAGTVNTSMAAVAAYNNKYGDAASALLSAASAFSSYASTMASYDRRKQEWVFQKTLAQQDIQIGNQQINIAEDHVKVAEQEVKIAELQTDHAERSADFLANKFTNTELYEWMSGVLEGVYRYFLQQATSMAQLASSQLAFERQETPPTFIQSDYWEPPSEDNLGGGQGQGPDRHGLTGSARLLQDIYQLDQYAFESNKRKLQLSKTISLAQLAPVEFQQFRETGVMTFATPMEMFDRDFPGHYLRLIRRVKTSVIALIPPGIGVRTTLTASRSSRVVIGGDIFQTVRVQHGPDVVALTSPHEATGLFEMDTQPEMQAPFENIGVDAFWEIKMPKASNPFDFNTIADVLFTIEYTALNSFDYQAKVIQNLRPKTSADQAYSFRLNFADQWYDLYNPELVNEEDQMIAAFETQRQDFPPNLLSLKIQQVVLYFARKDGTTFEIPVTSLRFIEQGGAGTVGGAATSIDGIISTRRGNASSWMSMIGKSPFGKWELALPKTNEIKNRFKKEEIEDILFVITYSGRTPEWPA